MKRTSLVRASSRLPQFIAPFLIVSLSVWITLPARFDRFFNLFQSTTKHWSIGAKLFSYLNILISLGRIQGPFDCLKSYL